MGGVCSWGADVLGQVSDGRMSGADILPKQTTRYDGKRAEHGEIFVVQSLLKRFISVDTQI